MLLALIVVHFPSDLLLIKNQPRLLMTTTNAPVVFLSPLFSPFLSSLLPALLLFIFIDVYWRLRIGWAHTAIVCAWYLVDDLWELVLSFHYVVPGNATLGQQLQLPTKPSCRPTLTLFIMPLCKNKSREVDSDQHLVRTPVHHFPKHHLPIPAQSLGRTNKAFTLI